jgi:hypothetical protein
LSSNSLAYSLAASAYVAAKYSARIDLPANFWEKASTVVNSSSTITMAMIFFFIINSLLVTCLGANGIAAGTQGGTFLNRSISTSFAEIAIRFYS